MADRALVLGAALGLFVLRCPGVADGATVEGGVLRYDPATPPAKLRDAIMVALIRHVAHTHLPK